MKKFVIILLSFILIIFNLNACTSNNSSPSNTPSNNSSQSKTPSNNTDTSKSTSVLENTPQTQTCNHIWNNATCTTAKTCSICNITEGTKLGHSWTEATCKTLKTCSKCGETSGRLSEHSYKNGICIYCYAPEPNGTPTYTFEDTFNFEGFYGDFQISIGNNYSFTYVDNEFSDKHLKPVVRIPITIKNIGTEIAHLHSPSDYEFFDSTGVQTTTSLYVYFINDFDDGKYLETAIRPGASLTVPIYMLYSGDGDYYVLFKYFGTSSTKIEVKLPIEKR